MCGFEIGEKVCVVGCEIWTGEPDAGSGGGRGKTPAAAMRPMIDGPAAPPATPSDASAQNLFEPLALALFQCVAIIAAGYAARLASVFSTSEAAGISAFVARVALPSLVFLQTATLDLAGIELGLIASIMCSKLILFAMVVAVSALTSSAEWQTAVRRASLLASPRLAPASPPIAPTSPPACSINTAAGTPERLVQAPGFSLPQSAAPAPHTMRSLLRRVRESRESRASCEAPVPVRFALHGSSYPDPPEPPNPRAWMRRAGLYAIFTTRAHRGRAEPCEAAPPWPRQSLPLLGTAPPPCA